MATNDSAARLSWAALFGLLTAATAGGCSTSAGSCETDQLPPTDPCFQKDCCDRITIGPDGGVIEDAGSAPDAGVTTRLCGACNG